MSTFDRYVSVAWPRLLRSAWLLTGDWHLAEDLLQSVLARAYHRWHRLEQDAPDAYLRCMLATTFLSWRRRRWRTEVPTSPMPDVNSADEYGDAELRAALGRAVARLPRQQRAVLMLRFHADLTEAVTAQVLGIGIGTVKSYTARALATLRADPAMRALREGEVAE